jgi:hypothetical protein
LPELDPGPPVTATADDGDGDAVALGDGDAGVGEAAAATLGTGVGFGFGAGFGVGFGVAFTVGFEAGFWVGFGVGLGVGFGVGFGVGLGVGFGVGFGVGGGGGGGAVGGGGVGVAGAVTVNDAGVTRMWSQIWPPLNVARKVYVQVPAGSFFEPVYVTPAANSDPFGWRSVHAPLMRSRTACGAVPVVSVTFTEKLNVVAVVPDPGLAAPLAIVSVPHVRARAAPAPIPMTDTRRAPTSESPTTRPFLGPPPGTITRSPDTCAMRARLGPPWGLVCGADDGPGWYVRQARDRARRLDAPAIGWWRQPFGSSRTTLRAAFSGSMPL